MRIKGIGSLLLSAPIVKRFRLKKLSRFGPKFAVFVDEQGFKISFTFYNPKKAHPCMISRILSYRT